jgi:hypothetical protein
VVDESGYLGGSRAVWRLELVRGLANSRMRRMGKRKNKQLNKLDDFERSSTFLEDRNAASMQCHSQ